MTSGANPLTSHATRAARSPGEPTLAAVFVNSALAALERTDWGLTPQQRFCATEPRRTAEG